MTEEAALAAALAGEHAAIYGYGVLGARLDDRTRDLALTAYERHRAQRGALQAAMRSRRLTPPATAAAYDITVANRAQAIALAERLEVGLGVLYRDLVGAGSDDRLRALAVKGLQSTAVQVVKWRRLHGAHPLPDPLPGQASPR